ncbi:PP2C family protein-serine/threonine phosphatase [Allostreptomyces psammosilenae]|uniref:PAS domain S-box-containing protein n=1 Tax=Allostreptomyces psammosilenae TaxID=1892865 RepID=A0A852ZYM4_9ACTN|nr:PP2C family protein-serine/threonine phosphatase [Allostreptomyces psammosilenae]NYI07483.1 PAS domain S-box-containing protein [Allostreptomyces psammosilenae]
MDSLISSTTDLLRQVESVRGGVSGEETTGPWQAALYDLATQYLAELQDHLGRLRESLVPPADSERHQGPAPEDLLAFRRERYLRAMEAEAAMRSANTRGDDGDGRGGPTAMSAHDFNLHTRMATAEWNLLHDRISWSTELYRIFGREASDGPLTLDQLPAYLYPEDQQSVAGLITSSLVDGKPIDGEFRIVRPDGSVRTVHCAGEPELSDDGTAVAMRVAFQDITELRRAQSDLRQARQHLVHMRDRIEAEHQMAVELQQAVLPAWGSTLRLESHGRPTLDLATRYLPAESLAKIGGDWYDALPLPNGTVLLSLGDMEGHGLPAASGMAMMRNALRGLAITGASPARMLTWLNQLLTQARSETTATAVCALFDQETRVLTWSHAGHPAPVLYRGGVARRLESPEGVMLGATDCIDYGEQSEQLAPGDLLLLYTDGLLERRGELPERAASERLFDLAPRISAAPDAGACVELVFGELDETEYEDDVCVLAVRVL